MTAQYMCPGCEELAASQDGLYCEECTDSLAYPCLGCGTTDPKNFSDWDDYFCMYCTDEEQEEENEE